MNGLVFTDVYIVSIVPDGQMVAVGNIGVVAVLGGSNALHIAEFLCLGEGFFAPCSGDDVVGNTVFHQVHGNHRKLQGGTALNEQNLVVFRNVHQFPQIGNSIVKYLLIHFGAVGHLHNGHTGATVVQHFIPDLFQYRYGHGGRTCGEVIRAIIHDKYPPCPSSLDGILSIILQNVAIGNCAF